MHRGGESSRSRGGRKRGRRGGDHNGDDQSNRRGRHPPGLTGLDIGLWYARRGKSKREKLDIQKRSVITLNKDHEAQISSLLHDMKTDVPIKDEGGSSSTLASSTSPTSTSPPSTSPPLTSPPLTSPSSTSPSSRFNLDIVKLEEMEVENIKEEEKTFNDNKITLEVNKVKFEYTENRNCALKSDPDFDEKIYSDFIEMKEETKCKMMLEFRKKLPAYKMKETLLQLVSINQVLVISGETGCGKTTQVAQFILDDFVIKKRASECHIICTQPRRISAISVAERVASERGETCGNTCGYQIRLESHLPRSRASILYCTTGILLRRLINDPYLANVSHIILDEIHERDLMSDFLMVIVKDLLPHRPDVKVILMSATLNAEMFSTYFNNCPMLYIPGFTYDVTEYFLEQILDLTRFYITPPLRKRPIYGKNRKVKLEEQERFSDYIYSIQNKYTRYTIESLDNMDHEYINHDLILHVIKYICRNFEDGAILVFMPGWDQISKLHDMLEKEPCFDSSNSILIPLHSLMPTTNQREVFERPPPGVRKIIIATNIAETSITIEDVVFVIDTGKTKEKTYDVENNISCLQPVWISKASAKQRKGRAGRVQKGICFHLYTQYHYDNFQEYQLPEMLRTPLDQLCLQLKILRLGRMWKFLLKAIEPPTKKAVDNAIECLTQMRALDEHEDLTPLGYHLAKIPVAPKVGRMILFGAIFSCLDPVLTIAASLDFKDPFYIPIHKEKEADVKKNELSRGSKSDHIMLINAFKGWEESKLTGTEGQYCWRYFLSINTLRMIDNMKKQFAQLLYDIGFLTNSCPKNPAANIQSENVNVIKATICAGLYPNVAKVIPGKEGKKRPPKLGTASYGRVEIHPKSVNSDVRQYESQWLIYHQKMRTNKLYLFDSTMIAPFPLLFFGGKITVHQENGHDTIEVDEWIKFHSPLKTAQLVKKLRHELDILLNKKINNPAMELGVGHMTESRDERILAAIIDLITTEKVKTKSDTGYK